MSGRKSSESDKNTNININLNVSIQLERMNLKRSRGSNGASSPINVVVTGPNFNVDVNEPTKPQEFDLFKLGGQFIKRRRSRSVQIQPENLFKFYQDKMKWINDTSGEVLSVEMKDTSEWCQAIRGRITEKFVHSAAATTGRQNNTLLVSKIMGHGAVTRLETSRQFAALKEKVLSSIRKDKKIPGEVVTSCGLYMLSEFPVFAATSDAISDNFVYKVLVPDCIETFDRLTAKKFTESELNEYHFIMHMTGRKKIYLFIPHNKYPVIQTINTVSVDYDETLAIELIEDALAFWKSEIYPLIFQE